MGKHARVIARKKNPQLVNLVNKLYTLSAAQKTRIWKDVAKRLESPSSQFATVNLARIERIAREGEVLLIPGKLLGTGSISKKVTIGAFSHSGSAAKKLAEAGGTLVSIEKLAETNPAGSNIRIIV